MRIRAIIAIVVLMVPTEASAQRLRLPRMGRGPTRPAPLPAPPATIARELSYVRLPVSVESYPLITHFQSSGFAAPNAPSSWTSAGAGTRVDYRVTRHVSATIDMTSSLFGGPARTQTLELGTRLRPERSDRRVYPFVDFRFGYMLAYNNYFQPFDLVDPYGTSTPGPGSRYSDGVGGIGGVGLEYALTRTLSLTTAGSVMRARMTTRSFQGANPSSDSYRMTSYRYMLGLRWNPVRFLRPTNTELSAAPAP